MSIESNAFGRIRLTGKDAKKFRNQITYGRATPAAKEAVARGILLAATLKKNGSVRLKIKTSA